MHGFEWKDQRGIEGTGFVRAIRQLLTARIPQLKPKLSSIISSTFNKEVLKSSSDGTWYRVSLFNTATKIIANVNCRLFFPPELGKHLTSVDMNVLRADYSPAEDEEFLEAALNFPTEAFLAAEILQLLPACIAK
jgi:hypothetical protein